MAYSPTTWVDGVTPVDASRLNNLEGGITTLETNIIKKVDAAGDLLYGSGADALAKLALGAAGLKLFVNAGATAPEWSKGLKTGAASHNLVDASATQAITGVGFKPSALILFGNVDATKIFVLGVYDGNSFNGIYAGADGALTYGTGVAYATGVGDYQVLGVNSLDSDGFTLDWTKTGSPTGTAYVAYLAIR